MRVKQKRDPSILRERPTKSSWVGVRLSVIQCMITRVVGCNQWSVNERGNATSDVSSVMPSTFYRDKDTSDNTHWHGHRLVRWHWLLSTDVSLSVVCDGLMLCFTLLLLLLVVVCTVYMIMYSIHFPAQQPAVWTCIVGVEFSVHAGFVQFLMCIINHQSFLKVFRQSKFTT